MSSVLHNVLLSWHTRLPLRSASNWILSWQVVRSTSIIFTIILNNIMLPERASGDLCLPARRRMHALGQAAVCSVFAYMHACLRMHLHMASELMGANGNGWHGS